MPNNMVLEKVMTTQHQQLKILCQCFCLPTGGGKSFCLPLVFEFFVEYNSDPLSRRIMLVMETVLHSFRKRCWDAPCIQLILLLFSSCLYHHPCLILPFYEIIILVLYVSVYHCKCAWNKLLNRYFNPYDYHGMRHPDFSPVMSPHCVRVPKCCDTISRSKANSGSKPSVCVCV